MRYLLLIYGPDFDPSHVSPAEMEVSMESWTNFTADLVRRGVMVAGDALERTDTATTVRVRNGQTMTTDGPFAETTEVLGGYYLLNVKDLEEAIGIAAACPAAERGSVELRPIQVWPEYQQAVAERAGMTGT
jgi:hypothetical protein